jgi:hypothetical protein
MINNLIIRNFYPFHNPLIKIKMVKGHPCLTLLDALEHLEGEPLIIIAKDIDERHLESILLSTSSYPIGVIII